MKQAIAVLYWIALISLVISFAFAEVSVFAHIFFGATDGVRDKADVGYSLAAFLFIRYLRKEIDMNSETCEKHE